MAFIRLLGGHMGRASTPQNKVLQSRARKSPRGPFARYRASSLALDGALGHPIGARVGPHMRKVSGVTLTPPTLA